MAEAQRPTRGRLVRQLARAFLMLLGGATLAAAAFAAVVETLARRAHSDAGRTLESYGYGTPAPERGLYEPHPFLGYVLRPGFRRERVSGVAGSAQIAVNVHGMRGVEVETAKPEGFARIVCIGGSTTFCTGAMSDATTWPARLEAVLRDGGARVEVLNAGVPGWTSAESLVNLALRLGELEPDVLLLYDIPNDSRAIQMRGFQPDYSHLRRAWVAERPGPIDRWLGDHSHAYARWRAATAPPEQGGNTLQRMAFTDGFKHRHVRSDVEVVEEGIRVFVRNLEAILALARDRGYAVVLKTFADCPSIDAPDGERYTETIERQNREIVALAEREGVALVDTQSLRDRRELFDDWMHYNERGCEEHAALVARAIAASPQLRARSGFASSH